TARTARRTRSTYRTASSPGAVRSTRRARTAANSRPPGGPAPATPRPAETPTRTVRGAPGYPNTRQHSPPREAGSRSVPVAAFRQSCHLRLRLDRGRLPVRGLVRLARAAHARLVTRTGAAFRGRLPAVTGSSILTLGIQRMLVLQ